MKRMIIGLSVVAFLSVSPYAFAEAEHDHDMGQEPMAAESTEVTEEGTELIYVNNKLCPISGEKVGEMGEVVQQEYNGKVYNFCCKMCLKDFNKDPDKYVKLVEERMAQEAAESEMPDAEMGLAHEHQHE